MANRPLSQQEIESRNKNKSRRMRITNIGKRVCGIQLKPPIKGDKRLDFFMGEQTINLLAGKEADFPMDRLYMEQIESLSKNGYIRCRELNDI